MQIIDNRSYYHYREGHFSMVNHCDVRLLERVCALAASMELQFAGFSELMEKQMCDFVAYNALYAVRQVLMNNQSLRLRKRIQAVNTFLTDPAIARSLLCAHKETSSANTKWKLHMVLKKHLYLLIFVYKILDR